MGSTDVEGESGTGDGACVSSDFETVAVGTDERLVDVAAGRDDRWLLLKGTDGALVLQQVLGGERLVLEPAGSTGAAISGRPDGEICVVWGVGELGAATVKTACSPSFAVIDTGIALAVATDYPVAFHDDGSEGAAVLFAEVFSLDGLTRDGDGAWADANILESSISFAGGPRALSGSASGSPFCFVSQGSVVVERWGQSGSANEIGVLRPESAQVFYEDVGCAVAVRGESMGVVAVGAGRATLAVRTHAFAQLVEHPLDAEGITGWGFGATPTEFVMVYAAGDGLFRARVAVDGGAPEVEPVTQPDDATDVRNVALTHGVDGTESLAVEADDSVHVRTICAPR